MALNMRRVHAVLLTASLILMSMSAPVLAAGGGSVTTSLTGTDLAQCSGTSTFTLTITGVQPPPGQVPVDVMLVLDKSGSMAGTPMTDLKNAANHFVTTMDGFDGTVDGTIATSQVGMVSFNQTPVLNMALTHNAALAHSQINALVAGGSTNIGGGVQTGTSALSAATHKKVMILMTDGQSNVGPDPVLQASAAKAAGIELYTIGLGSGVNIPELQTMATDVNHFFLAPTSAQLDTIFQTIATGVSGPAATNLTYSVHPAMGWEVTGASASKGTVNTVPSSLGWSAADLLTETITLTYTLHHTGATGGNVQVADAAILTYTDSGGNTQTVDYTSTTVNVPGCNQPPHADAGPDQSVPQDPSGVATVTLDGSGSTDDGQIQPLSYQWTEGATNLGSGPMITYTFGLGTHTVTLTVSDGQFTDTDSVTITVTDPYPPTTMASLSGTAGQNGWYTSPVSVTLSAVDNIGGSGVASTVYAVDGGADAAYTAPFSVTGDGSHTVTFHSTDNAGNAEAPNSVAVKIDGTAPTIVGTPSPAANANGWNSSDVTVSFACADATSGIQSCSSNQVVSTEGAGITVTGQATDNAGNQASATVTVNLDKTAPVITVTSPTAGSYPDYGQLTLAWTANDALSGLDTQSATLDGSPVTNGATVDLYTLGIGTHTLVVTATDKAGNTGTVTVTFEVKVTYDSLEALKHQFYEQGLIKNQGIVTSLDQKLRAAKAAHDRGQYGTEDNILRAFIAEVDAQAGKGIWEPAVTVLKRDAQWLMDHN